MRYFVRNPVSSKYIPVTLEKGGKGGNQFMYVPFGTTEENFLPELTIQEIGVPEEVTANDTLVDDEKDNEAEYQGKEDSDIALSVAKKPKISVTPVLGIMRSNV